ncbi:hypothetical protein J6590_024571 [Homalodisca vitripennis]|nr:hypothetical protein J6590_024571 [Homalodisca vitripennis]
MNIFCIVWCLADHCSAGYPRHFDRQVGFSMPFSARRGAQSTRRSVQGIKRASRVKRNLRVVTTDVKASVALLQPWFRRLWIIISTVSHISTHKIYLEVLGTLQTHDVVADYLYLDQLRHKGSARHRRRHELQVSWAGHRRDGLTSWALPRTAASTGSANIRLALEYARSAAKHSLKYTFTVLR